MKHPGKNELIDIFINPAGKAEIKTAAHIKECKDCAETIESLRIITRESDNSSIMPPEYIKNKLLSVIAGPAKTKRTERHIFSPGILRPVFAAAAVVIIAVTVTVIFTGRNTAIDIAFRLTPEHGTLSYNNITVKNPADIRSGQIRTEKYSAADLYLDAAISIKIAGNSDMLLLSAKEYPDNDNKKYIASFELKNGNIMVSSNHDLIKEYTITTPNAVFQPLGTEFILSSGSGTSSLSVIEGAVRVTSNNNEIIIQEGEGCKISSNGIIKFEIDPVKEVESFTKELNKEKAPAVQDQVNALSDTNPESDATAETADEEDQAVDNQADPVKSENKTRDSLRNRNEIINNAREIKKGIRKNTRSGKGR